MKAEEKIECLEKKLKQALSWWRTAEKKLSQKCAETKANQKSIEQLKSENAALRERLKKAVELKARLGDTIYMPWMWNGDCGIAALIVKEIQIIGDDVKYYVTNFTTDDLGFAAHYKFGIFSEDYFGRMVFTTIEAAESAPIT